jgi:hypothetical protein
MTYEVEIVKRDDGSWAVEAIDSDGGIELTIFAGPDAELRVRDYMHAHYGSPLDVDVVVGGIIKTTVDGAVQ